jgi:hypothetical protein
MSLLEDRVSALTDSVEKLVKNMGAGGVPGGSQTFGTNMQTMNTGVSNMIGAVGSMARGNMDGAAAIKSVSDALGILGPVVGAVTGLFGSVINEAMAMNNALKEAGSFGVTFGGRLGAYVGALADAGMKVDEFGKFLQAGNKQLAGWGANAQDSATQFLENSKILRNNKQIIALELAGMDFKTFQNQLVINADLLKFNGLRGEEAQKTLRQSSIEAAIEIDNMSKITGRSRQEIQKNIETANQSRLMEIAKMSMNEEQLANLATNMPFLQSFGKDVTNMAQEMAAFNGDVSSKEGRDTAAAMEQLGVRDLFAELMTSSDAKRIEELKREIEFKMAEQASDKKRMAELVPLAQRSEPWAVKLTDTLIASQGLISTATNSYKDASGDFAKYTQFRGEQARVRDEIAKAIETNKASGLSGEKQIAIILNGLDRAVSAGNSVAAKYVEKLANSANGVFGEGLNQANAVSRIQQLQNLKPDELEKLAKSMMSFTGVDLDKEKPSDSNLPERYQSGTNKDKPMFVNVTNLNDINAPKQASGSKHTFGDWFGKDWGAGGLSELHGREAVVPEGQIGDFISDMMGRNSGAVSSLMGNLRSTVSGAGNNQGIQQALDQVASKLEGIPATISSIASASTSMNMTDKTTSDVVTSLEKLNTKLDSLIQAVETGAHGTVKAFKQQGNLIA